MFRLIKNEIIKIFKRKNIYILLLIGILVISLYNSFQKLTNTNVDMKKQYENAYKNDTLLLDNYNNVNLEYSYEDILERLCLEKYAINNNIKYNILLNSQNNNFSIPKDARILLMQVFNKFDIVIIFIIIYLSSTIISEEFNSGTIKNLLIKPHSRLSILFSKIIVSIGITIFIIIFIILFQFIFGGLLFGFDSYGLNAIRYNVSTKIIETMNLFHYMLLITACKIPMYLLIALISLLFGMVTNNIALNILVSLGIYFISTMNILINNISKYIFIFNWDISNYLFGNINNITNYSLVRSDSNVKY